MSEVKISQLPSATTPLTGSEIIPLVQSGVTKKTPISSLTTYTVDTVADLRSVVPGTYDIVNVKGRLTVGDGGGGQFKSVTTGGPYNDNGGTIITQSGGAASTAWFRVYDGPINLLWFGVVTGYLSPTSPESTANTAALRKALAAAANNELFVPAGNYYINDSIGTLPGLHSSIPVRTTLNGAGPEASLIVYNNTSATTNYMFVLDDVNDVIVSNIGFTYAPGATGQASTCFYVSGDNNVVSSIHFDAVHIYGFRQYGICLNRNINYLFLDSCRIYDITNDTSPSPASPFNAVGLYFGTVASTADAINGIRLNNSRISACDTAIDGGPGAKYSLNINGCFFESNAFSHTPPGGYASPINFIGWKGLEFSGNYLEVNRTGTATADGMIKLNDCSAVSIDGCTMVASAASVSYAKNLISCVTNTKNVTVKNCQLEDPQTYFCYSSGTGSAIQFQRNTYVYGGAERTTYSDIMGSYMSADYVEIDIPKLITVNYGSVAAGATTYGGSNYTIEGVPLSAYATITATPQGFGSDFLINPCLISGNTLRIQVMNIDASPHNFDGTIAIQVKKSGSY